MRPDAERADLLEKAAERGVELAAARPGETETIAELEARGAAVLHSGRANLDGRLESRDQA